MERRSFVKTALSSAAIATTTHNAIARTKKKFRWRLALVVPKTLPIWGPMVQDFATKVKEMTQGELSIRVYGAGELVPALGAFEAVKSGSIEMAHSASYYWQGKIPEASFFCSVPFGLDAQGMNSWLANGGQELWNRVYAPHNLIAFPAGNTGMQMGGWFKREIKSIQDFKGLKMRIPGLGGKVLERLGGKPMLVPGGEIFTNLATGVIDAAEWVGSYHDYVMGFHKAAKFYYHPGWHEPGPTLELLINQKAWNQLPKHLQTIVQTATAELNLGIWAKWVAKDAEYLEKITAHRDVKIRAFPLSVLQALQKTAEDIKKEVAATSPLAKEVYQSYSNFQQRYNNQRKITLHHYNTLIHST